MCRKSEARPTFGPFSTRRQQSASTTRNRSSGRRNCKMAAISCWKAQVDRHRSIIRISKIQNCRIQIIIRDLSQKPRQGTMTVAVHARKSAIRDWLTTSQSSSQSVMCRAVWLALSLTMHLKRLSRVRRSVRRRSVACTRRPTSVWRQRSSYNWRQSHIQVKTTFE